MKMNTYKDKKHMPVSCVGEWGEVVWDLSAPLTKNHSHDYFRVHLEQQRTDLVAGYITAGSSSFINGGMNMEGMASGLLSSWLLIDTKCNLVSPSALLSLLHREGKQRLVATEPCSIATAALDY